MSKSATSEIAFIDSAITDLDAFIHGLRPDVEPIVLAPGVNALAQISTALLGRSALAAVHLVAHGRDGEVSFSSGPLSLETVDEQAEELAAIGQALGNQGSLRLWTCRTAEGERGRAFIEALSQVAGAGVAASTRPVGAAGQGGCWELDAHVGTSRANGPLTPAGQAAFAGVMALPDFVKLQSPQFLRAPGGESTDPVFGQIYELGLTEALVPDISIIAELGYGPIGSDPETSVDWVWTTASFNRQDGDLDEYVASLTAPLVAGQYAFTYRFAIDDGSALIYTYSDLDGNGEIVGLSFDPGILGTLQVTEPGVIDFSDTPNGLKFDFDGSLNPVGDSAANGLTLNLNGTGGEVTVYGQGVVGSLYFPSILAATGTAEQDVDVAIGTAFDDVFFVNAPLGPIVLEGREGEDFFALHDATGVTVLGGDQPDAVSLTGLNQFSYDGGSGGLFSRSGDLLTFVDSDDQTLSISGSAGPDGFWSAFHSTASGSASLLLANVEQFVFQGGDDSISITGDYSSDPNRPLDIIPGAGNNAVSVHSTAPVYVFGVFPNDPGSALAHNQIALSGGSANVFAYGGDDVIDTGESSEFLVDHDLISYAVDMGQALNFLGLTVDLRSRDASGYATIVIVQFDGLTQIDLAKNFEDLWGTVGNDQVIADDTVVAGHGLDATGFAGADTLVGGAGANRFDGGSGDDLLEGGAGDDLLFGGLSTFGSNYDSSDNDRLIGGAGNDEIHGDSAGVGASPDVDTAVYSGHWADYDIVVMSDGFGNSGFQITHARNTVTADDGQDRVFQVEQFEFADRTLAAADLLSGGGDTIAPTVVSVAYASHDGTLRAGETVSLVVTFGEGVVVAGGAPTLTLDSGGTAQLASGSGTNALTFSYTVAAGDNSTDLTVTAVNLNGATIKDAQGNAANTSGALTNPAGVLVVDTVPPAAGTLALANFTDSGASGSDGISNDNSFDLSLSGSDSGTTVNFQVSSDGGAHWTNTTAAQTALPDGSYQFRAQVSDEAGNTSTTNVVSLTVDTTAPSAGTLALASFTDSGASGSDGISNDNSFDLSLSGNDSGTTVNFQVSGDGGAHWTSTTAAKTALPDGSYQFRAQVSDLAGNTSISNVVSVAVDTVPPAAGTLALASFTDSGASGSDGISNDNSFDLSLSGNDSGATVNFQVSSDGGAHWTSTTAAQTALEDGSYQFRAQVSDEAGNTSTTDVVSVTVDTSAPSAGTLALASFTDSGASGSDGISNDNSFDLSLSGNDSGTTVNFQVSSDGGAHWTNTTAAQTALPDGSYQFRAQVTDLAGNTSSSNVVSLTVDTSAPSAGTLALASFTDSGASGSDGISNDNSFDLSLSGNDSGTTVNFQVSSDGGAHWTNTTAAQTALADGSYQFRAQVSDVAGNTSTSNVVSVAVDTVPPAAGTLALANFTDSGASGSDGISNDNSFDLSLGGNDSSTTVSYQVSGDGGAHWTNTTAAQTALADGSYQFRALLTDLAGNTSTSNVVSLTVDTTAPSAGTLALANFTDSGASGSDGISNDNSFDLSLSGSDSGTTVNFQVSSDGGAHWTNTTAAQTALADGSYQFRAQVSDLAGNTSTSNVVSLTVDTTAPSAGTLALASFTDSGASGSDGISNDNSFDLSLSGNDSGTTVNFQVSSDGGAHWTNTTAAQTALPDGSYQFRAQVTDLAGNTSTSNVVSVTVDTTAPSAGTLALASFTDSGAGGSDGISNDNSFDLSLSGSDSGATVSYQVSSDGGAHWTNTTAAQTALPDGSYQFRALLTDLADNTSISNVVSVTVDTTAPTTPTVNALSTSDTTPVITGTATPAVGETLAVAVNGATYSNVTVTGGAWSIDTVTATPSSGTLGTFVPGTSYGVVATLTDVAGNASSDLSSNELQITIDVLTTTVTITNVDETTANSPSGTSLTFSGTLSAALVAGEVVRVSDGATFLGDAVVSGTTWTFANVSTSAGNHIFNVEVANATGRGPMSSVSVMAGTIGNDGGGSAVTGTSAGEYLFGFAGNDAINGFDGSDTVNGGRGSDQLVLTATSANLNGSSDSQLVNVEEVSAAGALTSVTIDLRNQNEAFTIIGSSNSDVLKSGASNDTLDGGNGNDSMSGGAGDDTYVLNSASDIVEELPASGYDTVSSSVSYTLGGNVEALILTGNGNLSGTGNLLDNLITGNSGANTLDGGGGVDTLIGGDGNDNYIVDSADDVITEQAAGGLDQVFLRSATYTLPANVENLFLDADRPVTHLTGNAADNRIVGGSGIDIIDGGAGADTMMGDIGDDTYYVDDIGDVISDPSGFDTVYASINYTLPSDLNFLTLTGTDDLNGTGNLFENTITGNSGKNVLDGGVGGAADTLAGGQGDDTYIVRRFGDMVIEQANAGIDIVLSSVTHTLEANLETLVLVAGSGNIDGTGNELDNTITGNSGDNHLSGEAGNDTLAGGGGVDFLTGGAGSDRFVLAAGSKSYVTDFAPGSGGEVIDLDGLLGGLSNYLPGTNPFASGHVRVTSAVSDFAGTFLQLDADGGGDSYTTIANLMGVDQFALSDANFTGVFRVSGQPNQAPTGVLAISATATEGQWVQIVTNTVDDADGTGATNYQWQSSTNGSDWSDLAGWTSPAFLPDDAEVGRQIRLVISWVDGRGKFESVASGATSAVVNVNDVPTGAVTFSGAAKEGQTLQASNTLADADGLGTIGYQWQSSNDGVTWSAIAGATASSYQLQDAQVGLRVRVLASYMDAHGTAESMASDMSGVIPNIIDYSSVSWTLTGVAEQLFLTGSDNIDGTGNELDNIITGNSGNNVLDGKAGWDTLIGGPGDDTYVIDSTHDVVVEYPGEGTDVVRTTVDHQLPANVENLVLLSGTGLHGVGNAGNNVLDGSAGFMVSLDGREGDDTLLGGFGGDTLKGGEGNDTLDGGNGNDSMSGGAGDDTYMVDSESDIVEEFNASGYDAVSSSVSYTLGSNVEALVLTGSANLSATGNALDNLITGNSGANRLEGGGGVDTLIGGDGDDNYIVDGADDVITEQSGGGLDQVFTRSATYTLPANVENLSLFEDRPVTHLTGNAADNRIVGGSGIDIIDGGAGADTMMGGNGDDTYYVDNIGDVISDPSGFDTVYASITYTLPSDLNFLTLTGTDDLNGTGNAFQNTITGNSGNNVLDGGGGFFDTLVGGQGDDTYIVGELTTVIEQANAGIDIVLSSATHTLEANLETLVLVAGSGNIDGTGNELDNTITGNSGDNHLSGEAGNDTLAGGGGGIDFLTGGAGSDRFVLAAGSKSYVTDFVPGSGGEVIDLEGLLAGLSNYVPGANPFASGHVRVTYAFGDFFGTFLQLDADGGGDNYTTIANLMDVDPIALSDANFTGVFKVSGQPNQAPTGVLAISATATEGQWVEIVTNTVSDPDGMGARNYQWQSSTNGTDWSNLDGWTSSAFLPDDADVGRQIRLVISWVDAGGTPESVASGATSAVVNVNDVPTGAVTFSGAAKEGQTLQASNTLADADGLGTIGYQWQTSNDGVTWSAIAGATASSYQLQDAQVGLRVRVLASYMDAHGTAESMASDMSGVIPNIIDYSSVSWTLTGVAEQLFLTGSDNIDGTGNGLDNIITGNSGNNVLDGKAGWDTLIGGPGDDTYVIDITLDAIVENPGEGTDVVRTALDYYQLPANVENLVFLSGTGQFAVGNAENNVLDGRAGQAVRLEGWGGDDLLLGSSGNDALLGGDGNDTLDGGGGEDSLSAGAGDDIYRVNSASDIVEELSASGRDTVSSSISYTLGSNVEVLVLTGNGNLSGTGNLLDNLITGNNGNNRLEGGGGVDTLQGSSGNDILYGGGDSDAAVFSGNWADYDIVASIDGLGNAGFQLSHARNTGTANDGQDNVFQVEQFQFADRTLPAEDLVIDTTPPIVTSVWYGSRAEVLGVGEFVVLKVAFSENVTVAGGTPTLTLDSGGSASLTEGSGTNELSFAYVVAPGDYSTDLTVVAVNLNGATIEDAHGNPADTSGALTNPDGVLVVDAVPPRPGTLALASFTDSGASGSDGISNDNSFNLSLTGNDSGATVNFQVSTDGGSGWTPTTAAQAALADGSYQFRALLTDLADNTSISNVVSVTVDTTAPTTPNVNALSTSDTTPVITGTATPAVGETLAVAVNGATYSNVTVTGGAWSIDTGTATPSSGTLGTFVPGTSYGVVATLTDVAGNASSDLSSNELQITIDVPTTTVTITSLAETTASRLGSTSLTFTGTLSAALGAGEVVRVSDGATFLGNAVVSGTTWTFANDSTSAGKHTYNVEVANATSHGTPASALVIAGTAGNDSGGTALTGTVATEYVFGFAGNDAINGFAGGDTVNGGRGTDKLVLSATSADLNGASNGQLLNVEEVSAAGASTAVTIDLRNQSEGLTITGSNNADAITGGSGADTMNGGAGGDSVVGGDGSDIIDVGVLNDDVRDQVRFFNASEFGDTVSNFDSTGAVSAVDVIQFGGALRVAFDDIAVNGSLAWATGNGVDGGGTAVNLNTAIEALYLAGTNGEGVANKDLSKANLIASEFNSEFKLAARVGQDALLVVNATDSSNFAVYSYLKSAIGVDIKPSELTLIGIFNSNGDVITSQFEFI